MECGADTETRASSDSTLRRRRSPAPPAWESNPQLSDHECGTLLHQLHSLHACKYEAKSLHKDVVVKGLCSLSLCCFGYCQYVYGQTLILCIHVLHYFPDCSQFDTGRWPSSVNHSFVRSFVMSVCQSLSLSLLPSYVGHFCSHVSFPYSSLICPSF